MEEVKLALIPPISQLGWTLETNYQLMLPHLLDDERYRRIYGQHCADPDQFVILDNGAAEGVEVEGQELIDTALWMGADEVVIPDVIRDAEATQREAEKFHEKYYVNDPELSYMFVIQGNTPGRFLDSIAWATGQEWIDTIGIPRHMIETLDVAHARVRAARVIREVCDKPVHLLGASPFCPDELSFFDEDWPENVRGTDTSSPFNYAHAGKLLKQGDEVHRPRGYFDLKVEDFDRACVKTNIESLQNWTGDVR